MWRVGENTNLLQGRDLVVFSNDWDGDPLSKVHIMRILSRDNRVLWVNSLGSRRPRANAHDVRRLASKLGGFFRGVVEVEPNIHVLSPLALPLYGSAPALAANRALVRAQVKGAMRGLGFRHPISWSFLPASAPVSGTLGEELVVYHCVDEFSAFSDVEGAQIAALEATLLKRADLCIVSAEALRVSKAKLNPRTVLVRHGVDFGHFVRACDGRLPVPDELTPLPRPIMGFFGLVASWVDLEALEACAEAFPGGTVVVLGKVAPGVDVTRLAAHRNVRLLGRRGYDVLPAYCRGFDVALLPFKLNELTRNANPLKVREYLAAGLPVVASELPEVAALGLCRLAKTPAEFPERVAEALAEGAGCSRARAQRVASESWESRVDEIRLAVGEALARPAHLEACV